MKVLFVCTANICRSAYAEVVARQLVGPGSTLEFRSAGTRGNDGDPMEPGMAAEAVLRGASTDDFRSSRLTMAMVDSADLVLTAEAAHRRRILEERPLAMRTAFSLGQFVRGLQAAEATDPATGVPLLERVRAKAATARADEDVADPYGRGPAAARTAAAELEQLLRRVLPTLEGVSSG